MKLSKEDRAKLEQANKDMQCDDTLDNDVEDMSVVLAKYGFDSSIEGTWECHDRLVRT